MEAERGKTSRDLGKQKDEGREETVGDSNRLEETVLVQRRQGEAEGDAWHCGSLSAVALAVTQWSLGCYIYRAAV